MKYYIIAGEASGDLHGSNLMKSLKKSDPKAEFRFMGGDLMKEQGGMLVKHYKETAHMGLDVLFHLRAIFRNIKLCKEDVLAWKPDVLILIDYPGFNLRIAEFAKQQGIKVYYYISPKVWAWKEGRVKTMKRVIDKLFVIFPFEVEYFKKHGIEVEYFGNPLIDSIDQFNKTKPDLYTFLSKNDLSDKPIIGLIAGSRRSEITRLLPEMLKATSDLKQYQLVVAGAPSINKELYVSVLKDSDIKVIYGQTYELMSYAKAAIVTSGTATLETALIKTPEVVVFKTAPITYAIGRPIVRIKFFSLVNIILDREAVKELLQFNLARDIRNELDKLLNNSQYREAMLTDFNTIESMLEKPGVSDRVANRMVELLSAGK